MHPSDVSSCIVAIDVNRLRPVVLFRKNIDSSTTLTNAEGADGATTIPYLTIIPKIHAPAKTQKEDRYGRPPKSTNTNSDNSNIYISGICSRKFQTFKHNSTTALRTRLTQNEVTPKKRLKYIIDFLSNLQHKCKFRCTFQRNVTKRNLDFESEIAVLNILTAAQYPSKGE